MYQIYKLERLYGQDEETFTIDGYEILGEAVALRDHLNANEARPSWHLRTILEC